MHILLILSFTLNLLLLLLLLPTPSGTNISLAILIVNIITQWHQFAFNSPMLILVFTPLTAGTATTCNTQICFLLYKPR